ncbi:helix-turn-helix transcriptional regulator [Paractinoplanes maris]|uniref:helix-turn-helix transcriptional regulator n=1 Tax=Paractinoplanes maris TaxID=1734446 RepID=UPI0020203F26|nr:hypothetical protein [Actinoplanes maris]
MQQRARVTAADIARLAGVGRAAVSNWRKRYDTFPTPIGGTAASPQFDLDDVERWLADQGKLPAVADEDRLWRSLLAAAGDPAEALAVAGDHLLGRRQLPYDELRPTRSGGTGWHRSTAGQNRSSVISPARDTSTAMAACTSSDRKRRSVSGSGISWA